MNGRAAESVAPVVIYEEVLRRQKLQVCELAYAALEEHDESVLRWFTTEVLHFSKAWTHVVCLALFDKSRSGDLRWRLARNPLGLARDIAWKSALSWNPELIFGVRATFVRSGGREILLTDAIGEAIAFNTPHRKAKYADAGNSYQDRVDRLTYKYGDVDDEYDEYGVLQDHLDEAVYLNSNQATVVSEDTDQDDGVQILRLQYDWDEIGHRIGLDEKQTAVMKARASGITRSEMAKHLGWFDHTVQAVWRSVHRYLAEPGMDRRVRAALLVAGDH